VLTMFDAPVKPQVLSVVRLAPPDEGTTRVQLGPLFEKRLETALMPPFEN